MLVLWMQGGSKIMRKVLSFLLALALVFSLGASAYAQTPDAELQTAPAEA